MSTSNTGTTVIVVDDRDKTVKKTVEKTVNVEKNITVDATKIEEGQRAILDELVKIGQWVQSIAEKGSV